KINNVTRRPKLSSVALRVHNRQQVFKCIAKVFAMVIREPVNLFYKQIQCFRVAVGYKSVFENVSEKLRQVWVLRHFQKCFNIEVEPLKAAKTRIKQFAPGIFLILIDKKPCLAAKLL